MFSRRQDRHDVVAWVVDLVRPQVSVHEVEVAHEAPVVERSRCLATSSRTSGGTASLVQPSTKAAILPTVYFTDMGYSYRASVLDWVCHDSGQSRRSVLRLAGLFSVLARGIVRVAAGRATLECSFARRALVSACG